jgi:hypothetical protein
MALRLAVAVRGDEDDRRGQPGTGRRVDGENATVGLFFCPIFEIPSFAVAHGRCVGKGKQAGQAAAGVDQAGKALPRLLVQYRLGAGEGMYGAEELRVQAQALTDFRGNGRRFLNVGPRSTMRPRRAR